MWRHGSERSRGRSGISLFHVLESYFFHTTDTNASIIAEHFVNLWSSENGVKTVENCFVQRHFRLVALHDIRSMLDVVHFRTSVTLTLTLTLTNHNLNSNPTIILTLALRRVTEVRKWTSPVNAYSLSVCLSVCLNRDVCQSG